MGRTQERITEAVGHGQGHQWRRAYRLDARTVFLRARDDGRGAEARIAGNGLRGMRERLVAYGGRVDIDTSTGHGFALDIFLPLAEGMLEGPVVAIPPRQPTMGPAEAAVAPK